MNLKSSGIFLTFAALAGTANAQSQISSFREVFITEGETAVIDGKDYTQPGIYNVVKSDGTYEAVRLTVAPQAAVADMTQPYLNLNQPTSICVNWRSKHRPGMAEVLFGRSANQLDNKATVEHTMLGGRLDCWNTAALTGLEPLTDYYYQVVCDGKKSEVYHFRTMPQTGDNGKIRILLIGDHQRNEHSDYEWMLNAARETVAKKYGDGPLENHINFILNDGDQVDAGNVSLYEKVHIFKSRSVSPMLPTMTTVGNHELKQDPELKIYDKHYHAYGELDYMGIKSGTANYYAYQAGRVLVISINSDEETKAQKEWVRKVIDAASIDDNVDFIVSVQHRPLYAELWNWDVSSWMLNEIMPILSSTPKHVLNYSGHHHLYARGQMTDYPCYHIISGGGVGTSAEGYDQLFGVSPDPLNRPEVQKTIDVWSYQILEFDPVEKTMKAECYSVGNSRMALDNELVDSFSIKLGRNNEMPGPMLVNPAAEVKLPYAIAQVERPDDLLSTQFQISKTGDFDTPYKNILRNTEDLFDVDARFRPVDQNKGVDITSLELKEGDLANGTYYVRVRNRNTNLEWSEYSEPMEIRVIGSGDASQATVDSRFFHPGEAVNVSYTGAPTGTNAWVGIYESYVRPGNGVNSLFFEYTDGASGSMTFKTDMPGAYYAVLFKDGGYSELGDRAYFLVSDNCDAENQPAVATDKTAYLVGGFWSNTTTHPASAMTGLAYIAKMRFRSMRRAARTSM